MLKSLLMKHKTDDTGMYSSVDNNTATNNLQ